MDKKILWYTDLHLDTVTPWAIFKFIKYISNVNPDGIFLTGDISNGILTPIHLRLLAKYIKCPIYFVLGNHDYHFTSIDEQNKKIKQLCREHSNLLWMTQEDVIPLNEEVALIGVDGHYSAECGNPFWLYFTFDWFLTKEFRKLPTMKDRINLWQKIANESAEEITRKLEKAIEQDFKTIYILTHVPPFKEATRDEGTFLEPFWLPYNTNLRLGNAINKVMKEYKKKNVIVVCGHTHTPQYAQISRGINCQVGSPGINSFNSKKMFI